MPREPPIPQSPTDLVTFGSPPLNEVAIGLQFSGPLADDGVALADFWPDIRSDFPTLEKQPALPPATEDFSVPSSPVPPIQFLTAPLAQRFWFVSSDETRLIQLQPDRFILNWRQRHANDVYPRYRTLRRLFQHHFGTFRKALPPEKRDLARPDWCEVTYINHIDARGRDPQRHRPLSDILRLVATPRSRHLLPPEDAQFQQRSIIPAPHADGQPIGRLYVAAQPAWKEDAQPIYVVTLLARARPTESTLKAMFECVDRERALIVHTFTDITTPRMHENWGLEIRKEK